MALTTQFDGPKLFYRGWPVTLQLSNIACYRRMAGVKGLDIDTSNDQRHALIVLKCIVFWVSAGRRPAPALRRTAPCPCLPGNSSTSPLPCSSSPIHWSCTGAAQEAQAAALVLSFEGLSHKVPGGDSRAARYARHRASGTGCVRQASGGSELHRAMHWMHWIPTDARICMRQGWFLPRSRSLAGRPVDLSASTSRHEQACPRMRAHVNRYEPVPGSVSE